MGIGKFLAFAATLGLFLAVTAVGQPPFGPGGPKGPKGKKGGKGGPVFVEGDPDKSPLVTSISGDKPEMPKKAAPLGKAQVATISAWVKEGAKNN